MSKWEMVRLGDVCSIKSGRSLNEEIVLKNGEIPYIKVSDLSIQNNESRITCSTRYVNREDVENQLFPIGTTIFPKRGGAIATNKKRLTIRQICADLNIMGVIPSSKIFPEYLYAFFQKIDIGMLGNGSSVPQINNGDILPLQIPLPPLEVQKEIAQTLEAASELIALRKKQLAELDNLIKSTFYDMFGDPVANEKGWGVKKLGEVGELARGISKHRPRNDPKLLNGAYPLIQTGDVANAGLYINNYKQTYSEIGLQQSKIWNKGTLCITIAANIAKTSILNFSACFPDSIVGFRPNEFTNVFYINVWFSVFQKIIEEKAPESAQKNINLKILNDLDIVIPPIALQNQFAEIVTKIEEQKSLVQKAIDESQYLFDSLMSEYFE